MIANLHTGLAVFNQDTSTYKKWDRVFYFRDEIPVYNDKAYRDKTDETYKNLMNKWVAFLDQQLPELYKKDTCQLLHGDLHAGNIKNNGRELVVYDFEDFIFGTPLHDLSIFFFYYQFDKRFVFSDVIRWTLSGYRSIKSLAPINFQDIQLLMTARRVNFMNYILKINEAPQEYIARNIPRIVDFIENYNKRESIFY